MKTFLLSIIVLSICTACVDNSDSSSESALTKAALGKKLFSDKSLSANGTQSCATCHNPDHAFIDSRLENGKIRATSLGDNGTSVGDRNTPTAAYASFIPHFTASVFQARPVNVKTGANDSYTGAIGGQFLDGRESDLAGQAGQPPLNPIEMGLANKAEAVSRIELNNDYIADFKALFGDNVFDNTDVAYAAMAESIAEFEKTDVFSPFDSKYDRSLKSDYTLTITESFGQSLFFSGNMNCAICHQLNSSAFINNANETFSSYEYHNIGVPINTSVRLQNGVNVLDEGLLLNPNVSSITEKGKFKVPTLRNVAVTEPYMHNGVFQNLATVIEFYDHYVNPVVRANNPETGIAWNAPEISDNLATSELLASDAVDTSRVEALVCFLRILTDKKYEHLIQEKGIDCSF